MRVKWDVFLASEENGSPILDFLELVVISSKPSRALAFGLCNSCRTL